MISGATFWMPCNPRRKRGSWCWRRPVLSISTLPRRRFSPASFASVTPTAWISPLRGWNRCGLRPRSRGLASTPCWGRIIPSAASRKRFGRLARRLRHEGLFAGRPADKAGRDHRWCGYDLELKGENGLFLPGFFRQDQLLIDVKAARRNHRHQYFMAFYRFQVCDPVSPIDGRGHDGAALADDIDAMLFAAGIVQRLVQEHPSIPRSWAIRVSQDARHVGVLPFEAGLKVLLRPHWASCDQPIEAHEGWR